MRDVRKKGFSSRIPVSEVLDWIDREVRPLDAEPVQINDGNNRVLAEHVVSQINVPNFDRAMMDGYAIVAESFYGASVYNRLPMNVVGTSMPSKPSDEKVDGSDVVQIMTGAPIPWGANAVLPFELTEQEGQLTFATDSVPARKNVGYIGEDVKSGTDVAKQFQLLRPQDVGLCASIGISTVSAIRQPRVRIIISGNEIVPSGQIKNDFQIFDSNGPMLQGLIERDGGLGELIYCDDDEKAMRIKLQEPADVTIVSGGTSVGAEDFAPKILQEIGELVFHGIAMRPSSPTGLGKIDDRFVFLLPGNPVSCMCAYDFFAGRTIRMLGGLTKTFPYQSTTLPLRNKISSVLGRMDYCRVQIINDEVEPIAISGASVLSSLSKADGFVLVDPQSEGFDIGTPVEVFKF